jgi:hypothetical protein
MGLIYAQAPAEQGFNASEKFPCRTLFRYGNTSRPGALNAWSTLLAQAICETRLHSSCFVLAFVAFTSKGMLRMPLMGRCGDWACARRQVSAVVSGGLVFVKRCRPAELLDVACGGLRMFVRVPVLHCGHFGLMAPMHFLDLARMPCGDRARAVAGILEVRPLFCFAV